MARLAPTVLAAVPAAATLLAPSATAQSYDFRLVAKTGQEAPGVFGGGEFTGFAIPRINASGQVAFTGSTDGGVGSTGMWRTEPGDPFTLDMIVGSGFPAPGAPAGVHFGDFDGSFHHPLLLDDGTVGFAAPLTNIPEPLHPTGLFRLTDDGFEAVALPGGPVPGAAAGTIYESISNLPSINESGLMAFGATLAGPGVDEDDDRAVLSHWFGGVGIRLREGQAAPGLPGSTIDFLGGFPMISSDGAVSTVGGVIGADAGVAAWRGWPGAFSVLALEGDETDGGLTVQGIGSFWGAISAADRTMLPISLHDLGQSRTGLFLADGDVLEPIAVEETLGPIGFYEDLSMHDSAVNAGGDLSFRARVSWINMPDEIDSAILRYTADDGETEVLLREGDPAPGFWDGVELDDLAHFSTTSFMDDSGRTYVAAFVRGDFIDEDNDHAIWVIDADGEATLVVREGQLIDAGDGVPRMVDHMMLGSDAGMASGRRPSVNESGDLALRMSFTDGTSAIVVASAPPACPGDVDHDGDVDFDDLLIVLAAWGETGPIGEGGDATRNGVTDFGDLLMVLANWGHQCPQ